MLFAAVIAALLVHLLIGRRETEEEEAEPPRIPGVRLLAWIAVAGDRGRAARRLCELCVVPGRPRRVHGRADRDALSPADRHRRGDQPHAVGGFAGRPQARAPARHRAAPARPDRQAHLRHRARAVRADRRWRSRSAAGKSPPPTCSRRSRASRSASASATSRISFGAVFGAIAFFLVVVVLTRLMQRWLEKEVMPHTAIEPSLQLSIVTILGYVGIHHRDRAGARRARHRSAEDRAGRRRALGRHRLRTAVDRLELRVRA